MCIQTTTMIDYYFHSSPPYLFLSLYDSTLCTYVCTVLHVYTCYIVRSFVRFFSLFFFSPSSPSHQLLLLFRFTLYIYFSSHFSITQRQPIIKHLSIYIHPSQHPASQVSQLCIFHFPCVRA